MNFKLLTITLILTSGFVGSAFAQNLIQQDEISPEDVMNEIEGKGALITTQEGSFMIELFPEDAPNHVYHFLKLIESGYYEGTIFHRIIPGFMIQGGDPNTKDPESDRATWGQGGPGYNIDNEFNTIKHKRGLVSMARAQGPDSAGSQFFIVHRDSPHLDGQYTVFGRLVPGTYSLHNLDQIAELKIGAGNAPADASKAKIIKTEVINYSSSGYLLPPERLDSVVRPISQGGGTINQYINEKHDVIFNLPYRWDVIETSGDLLRLQLKPDPYNHSVASAVEKSGFIPQIFVSQEERGPEMLETNFVIHPDAFFSIKDRVLVAT